MRQMNKRLTTSETAKAAGVHLRTLQRWIADGKIKPPKPRFRGLVGHRFWSAKDLARLERVKNRIYRKGRGRKKKG